MSLPEHCANFFDFQKAVVPQLKEGSQLTYFQLYPGWYPGDLEIIRRLKEEKRPSSDIVSSEYLQFLHESRTLGHSVRRLYVEPPEGYPHYSPTFAQSAARMMQPARLAGEVQRITTYNYSKMINACNTGIGVDYALAAAGYDPKESFWEVRTPDNEGELSLVALWRMNYKDGQFIGGPIETPPLRSDIAKFSAYWNEVFEDDEQSRSL